MSSADSATTKNVVFISHASSERDIALALQRALTKAFGHVIEVFVSSDETSIQLGEVFTAQIRTSIRNASYGLFLLGPESVQRPWILIEFGAFWGLGKPAAPILHSGLQFTDLPSPIGEMNAVALDDAGGMKKLVANIAKEVHSAVPTVSFRSVVKAAARHAEGQKKTKFAERVSALVEIAREGPDNVLSLLREGQQEFTVADGDAQRLSAVALLEEAGLVVRRERGRISFDGVKHTRFTLEGTPLYTQLLLDRDFLHAVRQQGVQAPPSLEAVVTDGAQFTERYELERVTKKAVSGARTPLQDAADHPDSFLDFLDVHLPTKPRTVLNDVLVMLEEKPELRQVFLSWAVQDGQLLGQPWFVKTALLWFLRTASEAELLQGFEFIRKVFASLVDAEKLDEALNLYRDSLAALGEHVPWGNSHMNAVVALTRAFWYVNDLERRVYKSSAQGEDLQEQVVTVLEHFTRRVLREGEVTQVQEVMEAVASVLEDVREERMLSLLDHIGQDEEAVERMSLSTIGQACNALDHARQGGFDDREDRLARHRHVDMIAMDILNVLRGRDGVSQEDFAWMVNRAGLQLISGEMESRYVTADGNE